MDARQPRSRALFDHLHVLPVRLRLLATRRPTASLVGRHLCPGFSPGHAVVTFAVSRRRWWPLWMAAVFGLGHQVVGGHFLSFPARAPATQPRVHIQRYAAPEGTALGCFGI